MTDSKQLSTYVDSEKKKKVRMLAGRQDMAMSEWLEEAVDEKIQRETEAGSGNLMASEQPAD